MDEYFKKQVELLERIIESEGDCISAAWCIICPFKEDCISKAVTSARLLPKEERVMRAYDTLFTNALEQELDENGA